MEGKDRVSVVPLYKIADSTNRAYVHHGQIRQNRVTSRGDLGLSNISLRRVGRIRGIPTGVD